jgi:hypothetical protein
MPYGEASKALSNNLCRLQPAKWPIAIAVAASLLVVLVLPHNSNAVLMDQSVAGHVRSIAMFARAWLDVQARPQYGVLRPVLFRSHRVLEMMIWATTSLAELFKCNRSTP